MKAQPKLAALSLGLSLGLSLIGALAGWGTASRAEAQPRATRLEAPRGGPITGLEMSIDGAVQALPGGHLRWFITVYHVQGGRDLVPAANAQVRALASYQRAEPVAELRTDAQGRALMDIALPATLSSGFQLLLRVSSGSFAREVESSIRVESPALHTELWLDREELSAGGALHAFGRVIDRVTARPRPSALVELRVDGASPRRLRADARGFFSARLSAPEHPGRFGVQATAIIEADRELERPEVRGPTARREAQVANAPTPPDLLIEATPERRVASPGDTISVRVRVRTPEGHPVAGAILSGLSIPEREPGADGARIVVRTDAHGRATVPFEIPRAPSGPAIGAATGSLRALRSGLGAASVEVSVRTARGQRFFGWALEGGALIPGLPGRIYVRMVDAEGRPLEGETVQLAGPSLSPAEGRTDRDGVAVLESTLAATPAGPDPCGGAAATSFELRSGGATRELCAPVDDDATLRVRALHHSLPGSPLRVHLLRRASVSGAPVLVDLLTQEAASSGPVWVPLERVVIGGSEDQGTLAVPAGARGELWLRARPLVGSPRREVRGGSALTLALPAASGRPSLSVEAVGADARVRVGLEMGPGGDQEALPGFVWALPEGRGQALMDELLGAQGPAAALLRAGATEARLAGTLASRAPQDVAVAAVLRGGRPVPLHAPSDPVAYGLLRDPWRTRARFVRGRLGRLLVSIEGFLRARIPAEIDRIATPVQGRLRFNAGLLAAIDEELGRESALGLDGEPLTYESLTVLVPELSFDHVAARVTRRHLLMATVALTRFVRDRGLDYPWARRGDMDELRAALMESGELDEEAALYDGWGRPLSLLPLRARGEALLSPLPGYALVSAGPDGRFGTGDDLRDPFARVLRSGGVYAEAVGEDALIARLRGVSIDRARIESLAGLMEVASSDWVEVQGSASESGWGEEPSLLPELPEERLAWISAPPPAAGRFVSLGSSAQPVTIPLPERPRRYRVVSASFGPEGELRASSAPLDGGTPVPLDAPLPPRLRRGEAVEIEAQITNLGPPRPLRLALQAAGALRAGAELPSGTLEAGGTHTFRVRVEGAEEGRGSLALRLLDASGQAVIERRQRLFVGGEGSLFARRLGAYVDGEAQARIGAPEGSRPIRSFLIARTPAGLLEEVAEVGSGGGAFARFPGLAAWVHTLRGEAPSAELLAAARAMLISEEVLRGRRRRRGEPPPLNIEQACALFALRSAEGASPSELGRIVGYWGLGTDLDEDAAILAALATSLPPRSFEGENSEPLLSWMTELRARGWGALAEARERPDTMARVAAALLLVDRGDAPARALFDRAREALASTPGGGRRVNAPDPRSELTATLALAIAARQLGEDALAESLVRGATGRLHLAFEGDAQAAFWLLASSLYGAFGVAQPEALEVRLVGSEGPPERLDLRSGRARMPLPAGGARLSLRSDAPVLVQLESRYLRPEEAPRESHLGLTLRGDAGAVHERAGLELEVRNEAEPSSGADPIQEPVLEIELPAAARFDARAQSALLANAAVRAVEAPDGRGLLRISLAPLAAGQSHRLPLPILWIGATRTRSLALRAYDARRPWDYTTRAASELVVPFRERETW